MKLSDPPRPEFGRDDDSKPQFKKVRPTPLVYTRKRWFQLAMLLNFVFLYIPIASLIAFSFNNSRRNITWRGFTFKYYIKAFHNE